MKNVNNKQVYKILKKLQIFKTNEQNLIMHLMYLASGFDNLSIKLIQIQHHSSISFK